MNQFEQALQKAIETQGQTEEANKAYLEFIKANFIVPIDKASADDNPEVLYFMTDDHAFLPVFSDIDYCHNWASEIQDSIKILHLTGVNLLQGIGEHVTVSCNLGTTLYKEFNPSELARMRSMILKLGLIKETNQDSGAQQG
jgi:hypothetical protein